MAPAPELIAARVASKRSCVSPSPGTSATTSPRCRRDSTNTRSCSRPRALSASRSCDCAAGGRSCPCATARLSVVRCGQTRWLERSEGERRRAPSANFTGIGRSLRPAYSSVQGTTRSLSANTARVKESRLSTMVEPSRSLRERVGALRNLRPFLSLVWHTAPGLTMANVGLRSNPRAAPGRNALPRQADHRRGHPPGGCHRCTTWSRSLVPRRPARSIPLAARPRARSSGRRRRARPHRLAGRCAALGSLHQRHQHPPDGYAELFELQAAGYR